MPPRAVWLVLLGIALAAAVLLLRPPDSGPPAPPQDSAARFVPRSTCVGCHRQEYEAWKGSHHDLAMDVATDATVLGDFDGATFTHFGTTSRFFKRDGKFFVNTDGPDGKPADFEVQYTFGAQPLQQYLLALEGGRLQALTICWDTEHKRWFHVYDEPIAHDDELHWTGLRYNWNSMCAECHSTDLRKNFDPETNAFSTTWSEIDVSCQACHGPGSRHAEWALDVARGEVAATEDETKGLEVRLKDPDASVQVEACARCHARRSEVGGDYRHGKPFMDHYAPQLLTEGMYHADGQILDEVYVYGSFLQTKKRRRGVRCSDCHDAHTARLRRPGNELCVHCHQQQPPPQFETLKPKVYDTPAHHFHEKDGSGSQCVDCHMPARTYMVVDPRRDHSFRVPRPDLSVKLGTPNACNGCHTEQSAQWAAEAVERWYPRTETRPQHFAEIFHAARAGSIDAGPHLNLPEPRNAP